MKKVLTLTAVSTLACTLAFAPQADAYRATKTVSSVTSKADLPYFSDFSGCGNYKAYSSTTRTGFKSLKHHVTFTTVGGSVSFSGAGVSGSGTSPGYTKSTKSKSYYSSGNVCGSGLTLYLGMNTTIHVDYSNRTYTATAKI
ncbi:hypothetical protein [Exiguobacterium acetylicum]|uniref:hypothetical protein n=1 Tax=Exiguobacterium acetylicum TaxID=41170 RepID=UPI001268E1DA|nr:hypothetical protein [Exiguobacterium acetylicum]